MGDEAKRKKAARWRLLLTVITFAALTVFVILARDKIAETFENLEQVNTLALLLIIPLQMVNYHSYAKMYQSVLKLIGENIKYKEMVKVNLELNFVNNVFPSAGVSGFTYISTRLKGYGISVSKATLAQAMRFILIFFSYLLLIFAGLLMLAISGNASKLMILISGTLATLLSVITFGVAFIAGSNRRINAFVSFLPRAINKITRTVFPRKNPVFNVGRIRDVLEELHENYMLIRKNLNSLGKPLIYALIANLTEIACIYMVYVAFGELVNPGAVIIGYAIANFAGLVSVLPGGVGIYEGLMTGAMATAGVSAAVSLPATVMYRILTMSLQLPLGYYFYYKNLRKGNHPDSIL